MVDVPFSVRMLRVGETVYAVTLGGEVDMATAPDVQALIDACIEGGATELRLDMRAVTFCDSSCARLVLQACQTSVRVIVQASPCVLRTIELLGMQHIANLVVEP